MIFTDFFIIRGEKFRTEFLHLGEEMRSIILETVRVMAITTATTTAQKFIIRSLSMQPPEVIYIPPIKDNILYGIVDKPKIIGDYFKGIID